jgi:energy-coupling factor transport system permease protein
VNPEEKPPGKERETKKIRRLKLLRFYPGDSFLHRLDPRTKLLALVVISIVAFLLSALSVMILVFLFEVLLAVTSSLAKKFLAAVTLVSPLFILVIILDSFFSKTTSGPVWYSATIGFLHPMVTQGGVIFALAMGFRLLAICGISILFLMTTSHDDFIRSLRGMKVPPTISFSLGYALRSTTTLTEETGQIMDAQRSRGLELDRGTIVTNRDKLAALFIPVTVALLKRSKNTADAMLSRGFRPSMPGSGYKTKKFGRPDLLMGLILMALVIVLLAVNSISPA